MSEPPGPTTAGPTTAGPTTASPTTGAPEAPPRHTGLLVVAALLLVAGAAARLVGIDGSLWQDEFGTLWIVEAGPGTQGGASGPGQVLERSRVFSAQGPLYYWLVALAVSALGESELVLRLPSLLCGALAALTLMAAGRELHSPRAGLLAGTVLWLTPAAIQLDRAARPYSLAMWGAALMLTGYLRAVRSGAGRDRLLFAAGGVLVFHAQPFLALQALGYPLAHALIPALRQRYRQRDLWLDAGLQLLLALPLAPRLFAVWSGHVAWTPAWHAPLHLLALHLALLPVLLLPGVRQALRPRSDRTRLLWVLLLAHLGAILCAVPLANLLMPRWFLDALLPASLLVALGLAGLEATPGRRLAPALLLGFGLLALHSWRTGGPGTEFGFWQQDWRGAVARMEAAVGAEPEALVLFRSGFLEADRVLQGETHPGTVAGQDARGILAALRSPGRAFPPWRVVVLPFSVGHPAAGAYYQRAIAPLLPGRRRVWVFAFEHPEQADEVVAWLEAADPGWTREDLRTPAGVYVGAALERP